MPTGQIDHNKVTAAGSLLPWELFMEKLELLHFM